MKWTSGQIGLWLELVEIARADIILDKMEQLLSGMEVSRDHYLWVIWEQLGEQNGERLANWEERHVTDLPFSDWLSTDSQGNRYRGPGGVEGDPLGSKETL